MNAAVSSPLAGWRVLVTRAREQAGSFSQRLREAGAIPLELPAIEIVPAPTAPLDAALRTLSEYDWLIFTSVNGVRCVFGRLSALGIALSTVPNIRIAAIGPATAAALQERGVEVDFVPERFVAESVVEGLTRLGVAGARVLLARADIARDTLPDGLRAAGAVVDTVTAYRTRVAPNADGDALRALREGRIDVVTLGSPSAVRGLVTLIGGPLPDKVVVACIGPITAAAAREHGLRVDVEAAEHSIPGLVEALATFAGNMGQTEGEPESHEYR